MHTTNAAATPSSGARERLLYAALELFATQGFQAIGLRDLASHLGLHAGSLYHHIDNKQSLLFELIESAFADLLLDTMRRLKGARSPRERLQRLIRAFVAFQFNEKYKLTLITREFTNLNEEQKHQIIQLKNRYSNLISNIISDDYDERQTPTDDLDTITNTVLVILFGQSQWYTSDPCQDPLAEVLVTTITGIITHNKQPKTVTTLQPVLNNNR